MTDEQRREAVARAMSEREGWRLEDIGSDNKELLLMYADAAIALMRPVIRAQALEEAARVVTEHYETLCAEHRLLLVNRAAAIRALKEKPNG